MSKPNSSSNQDHFNLHLMLESILSENNNHDELSQNDILRIIMEKNEKSKSNVQSSSNNVNINLGGISNGMNNAFSNSNRGFRGINNEEISEMSVKMNGDSNIRNSNLFFDISEQMDINMSNGNGNLNKDKDKDKKEKDKEKDKDKDKKDDKKNSKRK